MKIKTTVTEEREIDIQIPFFRKDPTSINADLFAMPDYRTAISLYISDSRTCIANDDIVGKDWIEKEIARKYVDWEPITEEEFFTLYNHAVKSLSLQPQLA